MRLESAAITADGGTAEGKSEEAEGCHDGCALAGGAATITMLEFRCYHTRQHVSRTISDSL